MRVTEASDERGFKGDGRQVSDVQGHKHLLSKKHGRVCVLLLLLLWLLIAERVSTLPAKHKWQRRSIADAESASDRCQAQPIRR